MSEHRYDNEVGPDNAYGHALELLRRHAPDAQGAVHLDLACGLAPIASYVVAQHGVEYVGVDVDPGTVARDRDRGLDVHEGNLEDPGVEAFLESLLRGRRLASVTMLDGLEHLTEGSHVLRAISSLLARHGAVAVCSVPNATHLDLGIKNILGQWEYTSTGLLDETHYRLFSAVSLERTMRAHGLSRIDSHDVVLAESDQHFPEDHVGLSDRTPVGQFLRGLREHADPHGSTNQFIWAMSPTDPQPADDPPGPREPFLSVLLRTRGDRSQELREALLCLAAQSDSDFEVLLVTHHATSEGREMVDQIVADQPEWLRSRVAQLRLDDGPAAAPLNAVLSRARGRYVVALDDDDLVLGSWVASFRECEVGNTGRVLRVSSVAQDVTRETVRGLAVVKGARAPSAHYAREFSLLEHLVASQSPVHSWAFPYSLHRDFGLVYDESLASLADEHLLTRAAELVGVADIPIVAVIEHRRTGHPSVPTEAADDEGELPAEARPAEPRPMLFATDEIEHLRQMTRDRLAFERLNERAPQLEQELTLTRQHAENLEGLVASMRAEAQSQQRKAKQLEAKLRRRLRAKKHQLAEAQRESPPSTDGTPTALARARMKLTRGADRLTGR